MSWGGVISLICIFLVCVALTGCVQSRPDGWCAVAVNGICVSRWHKGEKVPSGEIDMRWNGATCSNANPSTNEEKSTPDNVVIDTALWCGGSTITTGKEW